MRLGIGSYSYGWAADAEKVGAGRVLTAIDLLEKAVRHNVEVVQIADNMPLHLMDKSERLRLKKTADEMGITLEIGTRGLTPENVNLYAGIAGELGSGILRVVIDAPGYEPDADSVISVLLEALPVLVNNNVVLAIENHDRFLARELKAILSKLSSENVGICLDSANSLGAGEGIETVTEYLAEYTVCLHIKDFSINRLPNLMGFVVEGRPAGQGMLDIPRLLESVWRFRPDISVILELWTSSGESIEDTLLKEERWVEESLFYISNLLPQYAR